MALEDFFMTLEDFFTLTEMKDGLTSPSRVHELVAVMKKERDCTVKNVGDATRQWAAVASTIAATDNRDCLDLFIQLDGLSFIDRWLKDAKKYANDVSDGFVEESLIALLRALEKLQIDKERSVSSGIWITVINLLDHGSSRVQDRARALFDCWKQGYRGAESAPVDVAEPASDENLQSGKVKEQVESNVDHSSSDPGDVSAWSNSKQENHPLKEKASMSSVEGTGLTENHSKGPATESELDSSEKFDDSNKIEARLSSSAARGDMAEPAAQSNIDAKESDFGSNSISCDTGKSISQPKPDKEDEEANHLIPDKDDCSPNALTDSSHSNKNSQKSEGIETPFAHMLDVKNDDDDDDDDEHSSDIPAYLRDERDSTTQKKDRNKRRTRFEIDYGMDEALEVARQVAQEVEREVVDYRGRSCSSSSNKIMETSDIRRPGSPDSINTKSGQQKEATENQAGKAENGTLEMESSQVTEVAPEPDLKTEKGLSNFDLNCFDLNQEVCSDDMEGTVNNPITNPISVVSASRPTVVASGSPSAPLQFEGILGWKGSAATSAFRPASPRKASKNSLDFDLNVAEDGDDKTMDLISGDSSLEVGPKRSERSNLDLNRLSNDGDLPQSRSRIEGQLFFPPKGHRSPSPASSSSSMQPSLRNFDLNDRPLFHSDASRSRDPVISILGTRVEVGTRAEITRRDFIPQHPTLANGKPRDSMMDADVARMGGVMGIPSMPYAHSPVFGYNGLSMYGPGGPVPYMVDTRVASMVPQMLNPPSVPTYSQPSFVMNMAGAPLGLNGAGASRSNFDLNSGFANEGGNGGGLRQFLMPAGQTRALEDPFRANGQMQSLSSSGLGVKRREPEGGWESYSLPYRHAHPQPPRR